MPKFDDEYKFPDEKDDVATQEVAAESDDLQIEIEDDTPPKDRDVKPMPPEKIEEVSEDELSAYDEKVQARIKKFTKGYHDERRAKEQALREREAAEAFARQVYEENKRLQSQLAVGSQAFIDQSKSAAEMRMTAAERKYKEAYESGDAEALASAQKELTQATLDVDKVSSMQPIQVQERPFIPQTPAPQPQSQLTPRTQKWVDQNKHWFGAPGHEEMTMMAMGLDKKLMQEYGADYVGSEEYFRTIDRTMRKRFPEVFESQDSGSEASQRASEPVEEEEPPRRATRSSTVVAPASRSTPPNRIKLKASEVNIANRLGVPIEAYAKQVAQLRKGQ